MDRYLCVPGCFCLGEVLMHIPLS
ncbi:hypothetical protein NC651_001369 [Populus alba x Populus x berolinensis]|nr:hypothetical protein NC651_001369 [Populus alba x Populus x berolinensis]